MRILLHDRTGVPFTVQLARELARREYDILYSYAAFFQSPKGSFEHRPSDPPNFRLEAMHLNKPFQKYSFVRRRFQEIEYAHDLVQQVNSFRPDILLLAGVPPDALSVIYRECRDMDLRTIFWVQDIYSIAIKRILNEKAPIVGNLIGDYYIWKEKRLLQQSDEVILITEDFIDLMDEWGVSSRKRHVIHNWTPLEELPVCQKHNRWAQRHGLADKFCFLYSGTLGLKHNPGLLLKLAQHYRDTPGVQIVVVSEGLGAEWLRERQETCSLSNLTLIDFQPFEQMPQVLGAADVLVAILEPDAGIYSAPSKVLTYLCGQRPLLLAVPPENLSARIVAENRAGCVVPPTDQSAFIAAAKNLMADEKLRQSMAVNARAYAERAFDIVRIADRFEVVIVGSERTHH